LADHHVVVVGAGVAGLVSAIDLARQGLKVTVLERAAVPGGKLRQVMVDGAPIDSGPTVFTMRWVFDALFADAGFEFDQAVRLAPLSVLARHAWGAGGRLDLFADAQRSQEAIGVFSGPAEARRFAQFCEQARRVYEALEGPYIRSTRPHMLGISRDLGLGGVATLTGLGPFRDLWRALAKHFHDPRLQQLFGRYATYCGSSPFEAPATLMLVAQVEMQGVWAVEGGMIELARALTRLAQRFGATIRCNAHCESIVIEGGRARGVVLSNGERIDADSVVFNGDVGALSAGRLGETASRATPIVPAAARSLSALTWSIRARTRGFALTRHNVFFDDDYASEFSDIFRRGRLPAKPTIYVCAQDRDDATELDAPERLLCLVNAPANGDQAHSPLTEEALEQCQTTSFQLMRQCGLQIQAQAHQVLRTTPQDFARLFPATGGALYGQATHGWMSAFARPGARSPIPGLYLAGGSVHPGPGVPMAALSGRQAAAALMASPALTRRSPRAATSGGISTP
jgi:1-hydroxycarotenoid 3,4-desaturase